METMTTEEVMEWITDALIETLTNVDSSTVIEGTTDIVFELGADSLDLTTLVMGAEEEFDIDIRDSVPDSKNLTVMEFAKIIEKQITE